MRLQGVILRQNIWEILDTKYATFSWKKFLVHHSYYYGFKQFRELPLSVLARKTSAFVYILQWYLAIYSYITCYIDPIQLILAWTYYHIVQFGIATMETLSARYSWDILYQIIILYILFTYFTVKLTLYWKQLRLACKETFVWYRIAKI